MKKKKALVRDIRSCSECPFFDYEYYSYNAECELLNDRPISINRNGMYVIPDDCPLEDDKDGDELESTENTEDQKNSPGSN